MSSISTIKSTRSENHFQEVQYNGKSYCVCYIPIRECLFVIDSEDKDKITSTCVFTNNYVCSQDGYIHRLVINAPEFSGKNPVDHINRIPRDNRKENLRITTNSENVRNRNKMKRNIDLPEGCGIDPQNIPKNIWFMKDEGTGPNKHGERWCLEIKGLPKDKFKNGEIVWKSTSNRDISLKVKLEQTVQKLNELRESYLEVNEATKLISDDNITRKNLIISFNEILKLSSFPKEIIEKNLVSIESSEAVSIESAESIASESSSIVKDDNLPKDCGVKKSDIPKYCYYVPISSSRGDKFVIDRHPKLIERNLRQFATTESKLFTTKEKFDMLLEYLDCLEKDLPLVKKEVPRGKRGQFKTEDKVEIKKPEKFIKTIDTETETFKPLEKMKSLKISLDISIINLVLKLTVAVG
jgi:hypothetical protein